MIRLVRGGSRFLSEATSHVLALGSKTVLSPPLYRSMAAVWKRSGYEERHRLEIMERPLILPHENPGVEIAVASDPRWPEIVDLDHRAFEGMWRMSETGLREAFDSTRKAAVLLASGEAVEGYALVGAHGGVSYLHRIAVAPQSRGRGVGTGLLRAALGWARGTVSRVMVLNVQPGNETARRLYLREGFTHTGHHLHLLGFGSMSRRG